MIVTRRLAGSLKVVGRGDAHKPEPELFESRLRNVVRYADPGSWITAAAAARAVGPWKEPLGAERDGVGVIAISEEGPQEAMQAIEEATRTGFSSPLRFPAANPGALVGVTCILLGFRGPTMNFIMPRHEGTSIGLLLADGWLQRRIARYVVVSVCFGRSEGALAARSLLLSAGDSVDIPSLPFVDEDAVWLGEGRP